MGRINLDVLVEHKANGKVLPRTILWPDGRRFEIDKILDIREAPALKTGGIGTRYLCTICGRQRAIFEVRGLWFVYNVPIVIDSLRESIESDMDMKRV